MRLAIDIGNSATKMGVFENDELIAHDIKKRLGPGTFIAILKKHHIKSCIISNVSEKINFSDFRLGDFKFKTVLLNKNTKLPITNLYHSKDTLGYDRIAAAVGANYLFPGKNILVITAGTALTINLINSKKEFIGGNISPGIQIRFKALNSFTKNLPYLKTRKNISPIGKNTEEAIINGVLEGILFEVEGYIERFKKQFNDLITVITGGDADFFEKKLKSAIFVNSNLILIGLNRILAENED